MIHKLDARQLAPAWLSVALATGKDDGRPALYRTVAIEDFPTGCRLVATDGFMLLHAWVPAVGYEDASAPEIEEAPEAIAVAIDTHGRAASLMGHLLKLIGDDTALPVEVYLTTDPAEVEESGTFAGMVQGTVTIEVACREALALDVYEGDYPDWRATLARFKARRAQAIGLNPEIVARLAKLGGLHNNAPLVWHFGGEAAMALVEVRKSSPAIAGAVMPVRWDFDRNRPEQEADASG